MADLFRWFLMRHCFPVRHWLLRCRSCHCLQLRRCFNSFPNQSCCWFRCLPHLAAQTERLLFPLRVSKLRT